VKEVLLGKLEVFLYRNPACGHHENAASLVRYIRGTRDMSHKSKAFAFTKSVVTRLNETCDNKFKW
jgi:hypothetical protein